VILLNMKPSSIGRDVAYMVAYLIGHSDYVAKSKYLDALQRDAVAMKDEDHGYSSYKKTRPICQICYLPVLRPVAAIPNCKSCNVSLGCASPYCNEIKRNMQLECFICLRSGYCVKCISNTGCIGCGKYVCKQCAFVVKGATTICSENCIQKSVKRLKSE